MSRLILTVMQPAEQISADVAVNPRPGATGSTHDGNGLSERNIDIQVIVAEMIVLVLI